MEFKLNCPCGQVLAVPASAAGSSLPCACGRTHQVPSLSELRKQAGLPAFRANAVLLIEDMKAGGELPLPECLGCGRDTDETVVAIAECEKAWTPGATSTWWQLVGFLFLGIWVFILRAFSLRDREGRQFRRLCDRSASFSPLWKLPAPTPTQHRHLDPLDFEIRNVGRRRSRVFLLAGVGRLSRSRRLTAAHQRTRRS